MKVRFLVLVMALVSTTVSAVPPPPELIALNKQNIHELGFDYKFYNKGRYFYFHLEYPGKTNKIYKAHSMIVVIKSLDGKILSNSMTWASPEVRFIEIEFESTKTDVDLSVIYSCDNKNHILCPGARQYEIKSLIGLTKSK